MKNLVLLQSLYQSQNEEGMQPVTIPFKPQLFVNGLCHKRLANTTKLLAIIFLALLIQAPLIPSRGAEVIDTLGLVNLTQYGGQIDAQYSDSPQGEGVDNLIDNDATTKFLSGNESLWVTYESAQSNIVTKYAIVAANDFTSRDPKNWSLYGSENGTDWIILDRRTNQSFSKRFERKVYFFNNSEAYRFYMLVFSANYGVINTQFAELEIWGNTNVPPAPVNFKAQHNNGEISLTWDDIAQNEDQYIVQKSSDGKNFINIAALDANNTGITIDAAASASYTFRIFAENEHGASAYAIAPISTPVAPTLPDITNSPDGTISAQHTDSHSHEDFTNLIDNDINTKYLTLGNNSGWLQYESSTETVVTQYAITSANDAPDRDPKNWIFQGSVDGSTWVDLDEKQDQFFANRFTTNLYQFENETPYTYYRLNITEINGGSMMQLAEWMIYGTGGAPANEAPDAPSNLQATVISDNQIILDWNDNSLNETIYKVLWSTNNTDWETVELAPNTTKYHALNLPANTEYFFKVCALNSSGQSNFSGTVSGTTSSPAPPLTIQEKWGEHNQLVSRVHYTDDVAIYFDDDMDQSLTWMHSMAERVWKYTKQTYGHFSDPRLYCIFHQDKYSGGHPATYFDESHYYKNVIDLGQHGSWESSTGWNLGILIHETGHIVEGASKQTQNSPAFGIWGDSKWMEIYAYDLLLGINEPDEAQNAYDTYMGTYDNFPAPNTQWFKNWFLPIYENHGGSAVLNNFFTLLSEHFPKRNGRYSRDINWGEFIHFWSAAANYNLKNQATKAFGWPLEWENQFKQAQIDFPFSYADDTEPTTPLNLTASAISENEIYLSWTDISENNTDGFVIERSTDGDSFSLLEELNNTTTVFRDETGTTNTRYYYRVYATNSSGNSSYSNQAVAVTRDKALVSPTTLSATAGGAEIEICWTDNSDNEAGFRIERATQDEDFALIDVVPSDATCYTDQGLTADIEYTYRVQAENHQETSQYSNEASAAAYTVTALPPQLNSDKPFVVWPNPASDCIYISKLNTSLKARAEIFSINGVKLKTVTLNKDVEEISVSEFSKGIHWVIINTGDEVYTEKIILN
jgi:hypothetical protein